MNNSTAASRWCDVPVDIARGRLHLSPLTLSVFDLDDFELDIAGSSLDKISNHLWTAWKLLHCRASQYSLFDGLRNNYHCPSKSQRSSPPDCLPLLAQYSLATGTSRLPFVMHHADSRHHAGSTTTRIPETSPPPFFPLVLRRALPNLFVQP